MHKTTHSSYEFIHFLIIENSAMGGEIIGVIQKAIMIKIVGIRHGGAGWKAFSLGF